MSSHDVYDFRDVFPDYIPVEGQQLPEQVSVGDLGMFIDAEENVLAFRGLRGQYDSTQLYNGTKPSSMSAFYGPGLYTANTDAALNPLGLKGDRILMTVPPEANLADARTFGAAREAGGTRLGAATSAVKWLSIPPPLTHRTFERRGSEHDAMVVAPSLAYLALKPVSGQMLPDRSKLSPTWMVLHDPSMATVVGKRAH